MTNYQINEVGDVAKNYFEPILRIPGKGDYRVEYCDKCGVSLNFNENTKVIELSTRPLAGTIKITLPECPRILDSIEGTPIISTESDYYCDGNIDCINSRAQLKLLYSELTVTGESENCAYEVSFYTPSN